MKEIRGSNNHLICMVDASTGYVEAVYKKQMTSTCLSLEASFRLKRIGVVIVVTRDTLCTVKVERHIAKN